PVTLQLAQRARRRELISHPDQMRDQASFQQARRLEPIARHQGYEGAAPSNLYRLMDRTETTPSFVCPDLPSKNYDNSLQSARKYSLLVLQSMSLAAGGPQADAHNRTLYLLLPAPSSRPVPRRGVASVLTTSLHLFRR